MTDTELVGSERRIVKRALVVSLASVVLMAPIALAAGPPKTFLRSGGERLQRGVLGSNCWGDLCSDIINEYPKAVDIRKGSEVRIRIRKKQKPRELGLSYYRRVNESRRRGRGTRTPIDYTMRPLVVDGETVAWDAVFTADGTHHYYVDLFARWRENDASWKFHFRSV